MIGCGQLPLYLFVAIPYTSLAFVERIVSLFIHISYVNTVHHSRAKD